MSKQPDRNLSSEKYITANCAIDNGVVYVNGASVFENKTASISEFLDKAYQHFEIGYPKFYKMDNLSKLGVLGTDLLLKNNFNAHNYKPDEIGVVLMNASASLDTDIKYYKTVNDIPSPALFVYTLPNIMIGEICIKNNFKGENAFFVFKSFDGTFMARYVNNLFAENVIQACICGWAELLGENYKVVLYLVEKKQTNQSSLFNEENIKKMYRTNNG